MMVIQNLATEVENYDKCHKIRGGLIFLIVDCDSLCIWDTKELEIKIISDL